MGGVFYTITKQWGDSGGYIKNTGNIYYKFAHRNIAV
jgi:hypothetical protein